MVFREETPRQIPPRGDADAAIGRDRKARRRQGWTEAEGRIAHEGLLVMPAMDAEGGREFSGPRTQPPEFGGAPTLLHPINAGERIEGAEENEAGVPRPLVETEHVHEPVDAVIQVNVGRAGRVIPGEGTGRGAREEMTGGIIDLVVGLGLEDATGTSLMNEFRTDQFPGAGEGIAGEEIR